MIRLIQACFAALLLAVPALAAPIRIGGQVRAAGTGKGIADAEAELLPAWEAFGAPPKPLTTARTDAEGFFSLAAPEPGAYRVAVRAAGFQPEEHLLVPLVEDAELATTFLLPAKALEVRALAAEGRPLAGLTVRPAPLRGDFPGPSAETWKALDAARTADAGGRLTLTGWSAGVLVATSPEYLGSTGEVRGGVATVRFQKPALTRLEVRNGQDPEGRPVAGALVRWRSWPVARTGSDGRLDLAIPASGALTVEGPDGGWAQVALPPGPRPAALAVRLEPARMVAGRVLDKTSGTPLADAVVWAGRPPLGASVRTGPDGAFRLAVPPFLEVLRAAAAGHRPAEGGKTAELRLEPAARLAGVVVDEAGKPVAGAAVEIGTMEGQALGRSRADGRFTLTGLRFGESYEVQASRSGFVRAKAKGRTPAPGKEGTAMRLVLEAGRTLAGRLVGPSGEPVPGAEVTLGTDFVDVLFQPRAKSAADGRFELRGLEPGRVILRVRAPRFAPLLRRLEVAAQPRRIDVGDVELTPGAAVEGLVTDAAGVPLAAAAVRAFTGGESSFPVLEDVFGGEAEPDARTGADGRFRVADLARGAVRLNVEREGYVSRSLSGVEVPTAEPLHVELKAARGIAGRVVGPEGEPVAGAALTYVEESAMGGLFASQDLGQTDERGAFQIGGLAPGPAGLRVAAAGYAAKRVRGLTVPEDRDLTGVEIALDRAVALQIRVLSAEGAPVAGVSLRVEPRRNPQAPAPLEEMVFFRFARHQTDDLGNCFVEVPGTGAYRVLARGRQRSISADVQAGPGTTPVEIRFPAGVEVSGRAVDTRGAGLSGVWVGLQGQDQSSPGTAMSGEDGAFVFHGVPDGTFRVTAGRQGYRQSGEPREVVVAGREVRGVEVQLEERGPGATLTGRLLGLEAQEVQQAHLDVFSERDSAPGRPEVGPDGRYEVRGLEPGHWHVIATAGERSLERDFRLEPGEATAVLDFDFGQGATLSGQVLVDGVPLAEARLRAWSQPSGANQQGGTSYDGRFTLRNLKPGSYQVAVSGARGTLYHETSVEIEGDREITIEIRTGSLRGRVTDAAGEPVADALVQTLTGGVRNFPLPELRSGEDGTFEERLAAGSYRVRVQKEGYAAAEATVEVRAGEGATVEVRLKPASPNP